MKIKTIMAGVSLVYDYQKFTSEMTATIEEDEDEGYMTKMLFVKCKIQVEEQIQEYIRLKKVK